MVRTDTKLRLLRRFVSWVQTEHVLEQDRSTQHCLRVGGTQGVEQEGEEIPPSLQPVDQHEGVQANHSLLNKKNICEERSWLLASNYKFMLSQKIVKVWNITLVYFLVWDLQLLSEYLSVYLKQYYMITHVHMF